MRKPGSLATPAPAHRSGSSVPIMSDVQLAVDHRVIEFAGVGEVDPELGVLDPPNGPLRLATLHLDRAHALGAVAGRGRIDHQHRTTVTKIEHGVMRVPSVPQLALVAAGRACPEASLSPAMFEHRPVGSGSCVADQPAGRAESQGATTDMNPPSSPAIRSSSLTISPCQQAGPTPGPPATA